MTATDMLNHYSFLNTIFSWPQTEQLQPLLADSGSSEEEAQLFFHHYWSHNIREGKGYPSQHHNETARQLTNAIPKFHKHILEPQRILRIPENQIAELYVSLLSKIQIAK